MIDFEIINTGSYNGDLNSDSLRDAFNKVNHNFDCIKNIYNLELRRIHYKSIEDLKPAFEDINHNFELINKALDKALYLKRAIKEIDND